MERVGEDAPAGPAWALGWLRARNLHTGVIVLATMLWLVGAFVLRPAAMAAHYGAGDGLAGLLNDRFDPMQLARLAGALQWASLAGLITIIALAHWRLSLSAPAFMASPRGRFLTGAAYSFGAVIGYVAFVWTPVTAVSLMIHDSFMFYDAVHRIESGQHPSTDFPSPFGAAMLYLPWIGYKIAGGYAGAIEMANAVVALPLCLACAIACARRYPAIVGVTLVGIVFLFAVPAVLEGFTVPASTTDENGRSVIIDSQYGTAMFYNRWGWCALIAMFVFLTPRARDEDPPLYETATMGALLAFLFWLKLSYFVPGAAAALLYCFLGGRSWRTLAIGVGVFLLGVVLVSPFTQNVFGYARDLLDTAKVSGSRMGSLAARVFDNVAWFLAALFPILLMGRQLKAVDLWVVAVIVGGTIFAFNQNAQTSGLPTLLVIPAYALWRLRGDGNRTLKLAAALAFALPATAIAIDRSAGFLGQVTMARREEARPAPPWAAIPALKNIYVRERENALDTLMTADTADQKMAAFSQMAALGRRQSLRSAEYIAINEAGMRDIASAMSPGETVVVLDVQNPLSFLTGTRPAKNVGIVLAENRTISRAHFPPPELLFADADHVMLPKVFMEPGGGALMASLYSDWLDAHYGAKSETAYWTRWSGRKPA